MKDKICTFWTKNVPGLDQGWGYTPEEKGFYVQVDCDRYRYDPYIPDLLDEVKDGRVLEIGCGLGTDTRMLATLGADVSAIDLSKDNVDLTNKGMVLFGFEKEATTGDAENLHWQAKTFDHVYSFGVLHHTPNTEKAISEVYRVLKCRGTALIMLYHKGYAWWFLRLLYGWWDKNYMNRYDHTPLSKMYSRKELLLLFYQFRDIKIEIRTFGGLQRVWWGRIIHRILEWPPILKRFGSFAIIRVVK